MGRLEPGEPLEFRMKRQERSFSGPPPAVSGPNTTAIQTHREGKVTIRNSVVCRIKNITAFLNFHNNVIE